MFGSFDFQEFLSAFIVLFAVIDIIGSIPIILNLKQKGWSKGMVLCITVEFYAILSLLASMLMIINISG